MTQVSASEVALGEPVSDGATLSRGAEPTGTIEFALYGPDDADCGEDPAFTSVRNANGEGTYQSAPVAPADPGLYRFIARYSGDTDNLAASGSCLDPNESVVVRAAEPPGLVVLKSATPLSRPEPGGIFTFELDVANTSGATLTITAITDDVYGNVATQGTCRDSVGTVLAAGDRYECTFPGGLNGNAGASQTDVITVSAVDADGVVVTDDDDAVITLTDVPPTVSVDKSVLPATRVAPGGRFTYTVVVTNTSDEAVVVTGLRDDLYGDLTSLAGSSCASAIGTTLAPDAQLTCAFAEDFTGSIGATQTDVVTVTVVDDDGGPGTADDHATVSIVDAASTTTTAPFSPTTARPNPVSPSDQPATTPRMPSTGSNTRELAVGGLVLLGAGLVAAGSKLRLSSRHPA